MTDHDRTVPETDTSDSDRRLPPPQRCRNCGEPVTYSDSHACPAELLPYEFDPRKNLSLTQRVFLDALLVCLTVLTIAGTVRLAAWFLHW